MAQRRLACLGYMEVGAEPAVGNDGLGRMEEQEVAEVVLPRCVSFEGR